MGAKAGPVFRRSDLTPKLITALREDTENEVDVIDRGGYIRVEAEERCVITKETLDKQVGKGAVRMPGDIEQNLSSFKGYINPTSEKVEFTVEQQ